MVELEILHCTNVTSKYGGLALQVGGVSDETVKYDREFCGTSAQEWLLWQGPEATYSNLQNRPLVREGATKLQTRNCLKEISRRKKKRSQVPDGRLTPGQTGWLTVSRKLTATATAHMFWNRASSSVRRRVVFWVGTTFVAPQCSVGLLTFTLHPGKGIYSVTIKFSNWRYYSNTTNTIYQGWMGLVKDDVQVSTCLIEACENYNWFESFFFTCQRLQNGTKSSD
jgi:hypothetical protein